MFQSFKKLISKKTKEKDKDQNKEETNKPNENKK